MRYLVVGASLLVGGIVAAIILNFQGMSCLTQLARIEESMLTQESIEAIERNCFIITNSYVYSLFAAVAGAVIVGYWYMQRRL